MGFCPSCGKPVPDNVAFCPSCGFNMNASSTPASSRPSPQTAAAVPPQPASVASPKRASHTRRNIGIIVVVIVVVAIIGVALSTGGGGVIPQQQTVNIVNGLITVNADSYESYQFSVPSGASSVSVSGSFTASGGSGNDIVVLVMDSTNFVNWQNGHSASTYYNSGQVTTGTISASLPAGATYYLVYSNTFSIFSSKTVQTTVDLVYTS